ncbi:hypothetical protein IAR55_000580 [Kwoniella newhampshirensis]|uniref:Uncharacterized protein n=1 Tax=Kwoniella newhampshirensis TaxID=1651941 RepID=A0AAW0Z742_9TREE
MSRSAKIFLASSFAVAGTTVWGVHYLQKWESDNMYQGVVKDEARLAAKAAAAAMSILPSSLTPNTLIPSSPNTSTPAHSSSTPLNTPSSPVQQPLSQPKPAYTIPDPHGVKQPPPVVDEDCITCQISPPPQLLEAQSAEERRRERTMRAKEYEQQKALGSRLAREQNSSGEESKRLV